MDKPLQDKKEHVHFGLSVRLSEILQILVISLTIIGGLVAIQIQINSNVKDIENLKSRIHREYELFYNAKAEFNASLSTLFEELKDVREQVYNRGALIEEQSRNYSDAIRDEMKAISENTSMDNRLNRQKTKDDIQVLKTDLNRELDQIRMEIKDIILELREGVKPLIRKTN